MLRRTTARSLFSVAALAGLVALAACSSAAPSSFGKTSKKSNSTDSPGTFGTGDDDPGTAATGTVAYTSNCDSALANDGSAEDFARSMGICDTVAKSGFGLVSAKFTRGHARDDAPMAEQHGIVEKFGSVLRPREGKRLGVLSTGFAQEFDGSPGALFGGDASGRDWFDSRVNPGNGTAPPGYPKAADDCPIATDVNDVVNVHLELKAPPNASGLKFDFNFHSGEWPAYICSRFNDGFVAYLSAQGFNGGKPENISFDAKKNPVSVNNGFFDRCTPGAQIGCEEGAKPGTSTCPGGADELAGTGFGVVGNYCPGGGGPSVSGGATGWLSSQAPVKPGETFTLDLMIWDTGDGELDSSVLLDNFQWVAGEVVTQTDRPGPR